MLPEIFHRLFPSERSQIKIEEISPGALVRFLNKQNPTLILKETLGYPQIFSELRLLPVKTQEKLLIKFFKGVKDFPHEEPLGKLLAEINNLTLLKPQKEPPLAQLQNLSDQHRSRLNSLPLPIRIIEDDWGCDVNGAMAYDVWMEPQKNAGNIAEGGEWRWETAGETVQKAAEKATRREAVEKARHIAGVVAYHKAMEAARTISIGDVASKAKREIPRIGAMTAGWIIVEDLMPQKGYTQGNPFEPLLEICKLGFCPIGIVPNEKGQEELVILSFSSLLAKKAA